MSDDALDGYLAARRRRRLVIAVVGVLLVAAGWAWTQHGEALRRTLFPETNLRVARATRDATPSVADGVDMRRVHAELLPKWVVALGTLKSERSGADLRAAVADLADALAPSPTFSALFSEMDALAREGARANRAELLDRIEAWSVALDAAGAPWLLEGWVPSLLYLKSYEVLADVQATADGPVRLRFVRRVDGLNLVEGFLGHSGTLEGGAVVVVDRITAFAADTLWPMLDPASDGSLGDLEAVFAPAVRAEIVAALPNDALKTLQATAPTRAKFMRAVRSAESREHCARFSLVWDWLGVPGTAAALALSEAREKGHTICPPYTLDEADAIARTSTALQTTKGLDTAFAALVAHAARGIATHEGRHVADGAVAGVEDPELGCPGCPDDFPAVAHVELSAYVASLTDPAGAAGTLLQACDTMMRSSAPSFRHAAALDLIALEILPDGCPGGAPAELPAVARRLEQRLFGSRPAVVLPDSYPARLAPGSSNRGGW